MRSISPPGVHIRPLGLVSWFVGGAFAPTGGAYPSSGGVYPFIGSGFVVCWGCICPWWGVHMLTGGAYPSIGSVYPATVVVCPSIWGVYICSLGVVSWRVEGVHLGPGM